MMSEILVLFDLDGVLLDTRPNMEHAWNSVRRKFPAETAAVLFEDYFALIGRPFDDILRLLEIVPAPAIQEEYSRASLEGRHLVKVFDGAGTALGGLKTEGYRLGIVTSKDKERTSLMMADAGILEHFEKELILSPDPGFRGKPAPDHLLHAMAIANVDPFDTIYIGDMKTDAEASSRAGCHFIFASWGYGRGDVAYWKGCRNGVNSLRYHQAEDMSNTSALIKRFAQQPRGQRE